MSWRISWFLLMRFLIASMLSFSHVGSGIRMLNLIFLSVVMFSPLGLLFCGITYKLFSSIPQERKAYRQLLP